MPFAVEITDTAAIDIRDIKLFVEAITGVGSADRRLESIAYTINQLATLPFGGTVLPELEALGITNIRRKPSTSDHVVYRLDDQLKKLAVIIVYPHRKDFKSILTKRILRI